MTIRNRDKLCEQIVCSWLDSYDLNDLEEFFFNTQLKILKESSDEELISYAKDLEIELDDTC